jgi:hypothetical protein
VLLILFGFYFYYRGKFAAVRRAFRKDDTSVFAAKYIRKRRRVSPEEVSQCQCQCQCQPLHGIPAHFLWNSITAWIGSCNPGTENPNFSQIFVEISQIL